MRSDPLDVPTALAIGRGTLRKMRQNLGWAIGYNSVAIPIAAGYSSPRSGSYSGRRSRRSRCRVPACWCHEPSDPLVAGGRRATLTNEDTAWARWFWIGAAGNHLFGLDDVHKEPTPERCDQRTQIHRRGSRRHSLERPCRQWQILQLDDEVIDVFADVSGSRLPRVWRRDPPISVFDSAGSAPYAQRTST
jgi:hypothetical protein